MNKQFIAIVAVLVAVFVGVIAFSNRDSDSSSQTTATNTTAHTLGPEDAKVQLIEYGDFQCPACLRAYPVLKEVKEKYGDKVGFQFRHFPLVSIHPNAMAAHRAAEAAAEQGKFWEMHDLLYENQQAWARANNPSETFEGYANQLSLDIEKYKAAVVTTAVKDRIDADIKAGQEANITGTPGFVLNGQKLDETPVDLAAWSALIDPILSDSASDNQVEGPVVDPQPEPQSAQ